MFNEAFWFFYWVDVVESVATALIIVSIITALLTVFLMSVWVFDGEEWAKPVVFKWLLPLCIAATLITMFIPPKEAFYAGAGQYIAETEEIDDTLRNLKSVIDAKLEELAPDDG